MDLGLTLIQYEFILPKIHYEKTVFPNKITVHRSGVRTSISFGGTQFHHYTNGTSFHLPCLVLNLQALKNMSIGSVAAIQMAWESTQPTLQTSQPYLLTQSEAMVATRSSTWLPTPFPLFKDFEKLSPWGGGQNLLKVARAVVKEGKPKSGMVKNLEFGMRQTCDFGLAYSNSLASHFPHWYNVSTKSYHSYED